MLMMNYQQRSQLSGIFLIIIVLLSACQHLSITSTAKATVTKAATSTLRLTRTPTPSPSTTPTKSPTPEPTASATATITPTNRWDDRSLERTPFPLTGKEITTQNVDEVRELAVWGTGRINDLILSPDGLILAVGTNIGVNLYDSLTYDLIARLPTRGSVQTIAFSVENLWIALGETGGVVEVFDYVTLTPVISLSQPHNETNNQAEMSLSFLDEGGLLTSVIKTPETIHIHGWQTSDWQTSTSFSLKHGLTAYFNPNINLLGVFDDDELRLQSLSHADEVQIVPLTASVSGNFWSGISAFEPRPAPSRDGNFILMNTGKTILHWEIQEDKVSYQLDDYPSHLPNPCSTAPDTCLNTQGTFSWECSDAADIPPIALIALTPDDVMILISRSDGLSEFRRASDGMLAWEIDQTFTQVTFSPGSEFFFGLRPDGVIEKRGTLDGNLLSYFNFHPSQLYDLAFSPDGLILAAGFNNGFVQIYDPYNGEMLGVLAGSARSVAFSPDGDLLAGGLVDGTVRIYQLDTGRYYDIAPGHQGAVTDLVFLSYGEQLMTTSEDCTLSLWNLKDRYRLENITPDEKDPFQISNIEISSEGDLRFISGIKIGVFVVDDTEHLEPLILSDSVFSDLALSPNGDFLATVSEVGNLIVDISKKPYVLTALPSLEAYAISFTQDGSILGLATRQSLEFWSLEVESRLSCQPIYEEEVPGGLPVAMEVAPDGSMIALGTQDGLIHIYGLP
jgi:WD40 repeat protein